jgi:hypothetical protein
MSNGRTDPSMLGTAHEPFLAILETSTNFPITPLFSSSYNSSTRNILGINSGET